MVWRNSDEGKAVIADGHAKAKVKRAKLAKEKEDAKRMVVVGVVTLIPSARKSTKNKLGRQQRNT